ncbi:MAG: pyruvate dehydrogenase complex dihydrolipoamide acetyltransferase [Sedimentitalea sp.]
MPIEILMPALSPTMEEGTLAKWLVKPGDVVNAGDLLAEIETDKATMEFEAVDEGTIGDILIAEGTEGIKVNTAIATLIGDDDAAPAESPRSKIEAVPERPQASDAAVKAAPKGSAAQAAATPNPPRIFATPLARRLASQRGLDLGQITGSGPRGRIVRDDVLSATQTTPAPQPQIAPVAGTAPSSTPIAQIYQDRPHQVIALNGMRKTIANRLTEAKQTIPHFYLRRDVRLDALLAFRADLNAQLKPRDIKLSLNDFVIKACAIALQMVPEANAVWGGDHILQLTPSDVAVAVAIEGGLFTPVLTDAHSKSLTVLSAEMKDLAARARERKLAPHEYQGGSFAISNLGMFGIENFDAVINPPHGAILAVGAGVKKPVVSPEGDIETATVMSLTLSVDHRVIDGALGAQLLGAIVDNLEQPLTMLV